MNRRAFFAALWYSGIVVAIKLFIVLRGLYTTRFVFNYTHILTVFLILPFFIYAIQKVRDKEYGGFITGRECMRLCLTILALSAIVLTVYHYGEVRLFGAQMAESYYRSAEYLEFLKKQPNVNPDQYDSIIIAQIQAAGENAFRIATARLFPFVLFGLSGAFVISMAMKRRADLSSTPE
jgi:hypothetical protein